MDRNTAGQSAVGPVARHNLADELTARILRHIREGNLGPGDRLPSTRELSARFAVATPTLREALRRLEATGAVEIRHGSGVYVRGDLSLLILTNPNQAPLGGAMLIDLMEARELIEPLVTQAAARNATEEQLAALAEALERPGHEIDSDAGMHAANMQFHRAIGAICGNAVMAQVVGSLLDIYGRERLTVPGSYGDRESDLRAHRAILAAMEARDAALAGQLMRDHLYEVRTFLSHAVDI
jgi:GntR family transcriptional regulator, transcriptional repressor for pyruvate dehydrogenase complex